MWLWLMLLAPVLWVVSYKSLAGLGTWRRISALALRTIVLALIVMALAEVQLLRISEKITVIYLLDQSQSIPVPQRRAMLKYVEKEVSKHRNDDNFDRAGVIVFGADAVVEVPPFDDDVVWFDDSIETYMDLRTDATNLASAMKLAQASFPEDAAKRIVVVSDGNENLGSAREVARSLASNGVGIDVVPVTLTERAEVAVSKVMLPPDIREGQTIEARVVIESFAVPTKKNPKAVVPGKVKLIRQIGDLEDIVGEDSVELEPGKNVYSFVHSIDQTAVYTYRATFTPDNKEDDLARQNNEATAFTHVRGKGRILLIEDWENKGEFKFLVEKLRENKLEVTVRSSDRPFSGLAELQSYDVVVLANVPRASGDSADDVTNFSDEQISMLVRNTQQMGCGLVMIGGARSFGAGGWANTEIEKAMPVDFQIKNSKVEAVGALVLLMHACELPQGNHWQKVTARESIKALGPMDHCGLIEWNNGAGRDRWLWGGNQGLIRVNNNRNMMLARLNRMSPGDMPQFEPSMRLALARLLAVKASIKHMIIISDGDPSPPNPGTVAQFAAAKIHVSTVAIGTHGPAGSSVLKNIASATGGKYYKVKNPKALPRIYQREARKVASPLIFRPDGGVRPSVVADHQITAGIDGALAPIEGYVLTTVKRNPLVEVLMVGDKPARANATLLATWSYGLGKTAVFTSDGGKQWTHSWTEKEYYAKLFTQIINATSRPITEDGKFMVTSEAKDGVVKVVINALDKEDNPLNFLEMSGSAVDPELKGVEFRVTQEGPGRYIGEFKSDEAGSYFLTINPGVGRAPLLAGVSVPYSSEFTDRETNLGLLKDLAANKPKDGKEGTVISGPMSIGYLDQILKVDTFRHNLAKAVSSQDYWPMLVLFAAMTFFADVFIRRVTVGFEWLDPAFAFINEKILGREAEVVDDSRMERLRSRKESIGATIDQRRAARFQQPEGDDARSLDEVLDSVRGAPSTATPPPSDAAAGLTPAEEEETYASRLMKAKREAQRQQDKKKK